MRQTGLGSDNPSVERGSGCEGQVQTTRTDMGWDGGEPSGLGWIQSRARAAGLLLCATASACYGGVAVDFIPDPDAPSGPDSAGEGADADGDDAADADGTAEGGDTDADTGLSCDVQEVLEAYACTVCHDATPGLEGAGLDLISEGLENRLLNQPSTNSSCASESLINGQDPEASVFLRSLDPERYADAGNPMCQPAVMPLGSELRMSESDVDCMEEWVRSLSEGDPGVDPKPFDPASVESSVGKVKYMLNGGAVTDEELAFVRDAEGELDEDALQTLIDGWVWAAPGELHPDFTVKLRMFLELSLQQRDINKTNTFKYQTQLDLKTDVDPSIDRNLFADSMAPMFIDTAAGIVSEQRDFREVVTTRRWRVSTAILTALVHADADLLNNRGRFDEPDKFGSFNHLQESDYSDWRIVNLAQATEGNPPNFLYENTADLASSLRGIGEEGTIRLWTPRVGFFNTFAFFDQWRTNPDNDFRITMSQTLIGALDLIFEAGDSTETASLVGLDSAHAEKGTACFGCHQFMDPMRTTLSSYYLHQNRSVGPREETMSTFAFHGHVTESVGTMDELAEAIVSHPRFATAWTQKMCMWANSQRCQASDPEFQRIAEIFRDGYDAGPGDDFRLDILVREFFASTLVTGATATEQHEQIEFVVSPTRFQHFCQATNARVRQAGEMRCESEGIEAAECMAAERDCFDDWNKAEGLGRDIYIRGSQEFSTPNTEDPIYAIASREVCREVSRTVVGEGGPFPRGGEPGPNVDRMVQTLMGMPPSHPQHEVAYETLLRTYQLLRASPACPEGTDFVSANEDVPLDGEFICGPGLNASEAIQHLFVIACESPAMSGIGF